MPDPVHSTDILDAALEYVDRGFSVIPVKRKDKRPLIKWQEFQRRLPSREEVESWWDKWPDANVAIVCGRISGIFCVDGDGPEGVEWMRTTLPHTTVYNKTRENRYQAIFLLPEGVTAKTSSRELHPEIDTRGDGGYFVAPPSIHHLGHKYEWIFHAKGWDDLPAFDPSSLRSSNGNGKRQINLDLRKVSEQLDLEAIFKGVKKGQRDDLLYRYACRLRGKNLHENEAWALIRKAAGECDPPFPEDEALEKFKSAWKHPPTEAERITCSMPGADLVPYVPERKRFEVPKAILEPGGTLQEIMEYIASVSAVSHPIYDLAGAIVMVGTVAGQRVMTETGLRTNIYTGNLGYSGSGKDAPQKACPPLLALSRASRVKGPDSLTSEAALLKYLSNTERARTVVFLDEMGLVLKGLKRPHSPAFEVPKILMQLFSSTDRPFVKPYATIDDLVVPWHHVSLYGASTPERFWESITRSEATDGFLARILIFESLHDVSPPRKQVEFDVPMDLVQRINDLTSIEPQHVPGNIAMIPIPFVVPKTDLANRVFYEWADVYHNLRNRMNQEDEGVGAIYGRAAEHAHKLALIHALSLYGSRVLTEKVGNESVLWATAVVDHCVSVLIERIRENLCDNEFHALCQKILKTISRIGTPEKPGASARELTQRIKVQTKIFEDAIATLKRSGEILEQVYKPKRGRESILYCLARERAPEGEGDDHDEE